MNNKQVNFSRFICLECEKENMIGNSLQRRRQREKYHIKDLYCPICKKLTKNVEVRSCDQFDKVVLQIPYLQRKLKRKEMVKC